jgi:hypothetical protein
VKSESTSYLGASLLKKLKTAIEGKTRCTQAHAELTSSFEPEQIEEWKLMVECWQSDPHNSVDPYQESGQGTTVDLSFTEIFG